METTTRVIDMSATLSNVFAFLKNAFFWIVDQLDSIYIFPHVSLLKFLIALVIIGMVFSAIFVFFDGDIDD